MKQSLTLSAVVRAYGQMIECNPVGIHRGVRPIGMSSSQILQRPLAASYGWLWSSSTVTRRKSTAGFYHERVLCTVKNICSRLPKSTWKSRVIGQEQLALVPMVVFLPFGSQNANAFHHDIPGCELSTKNHLVAILCLDTKISYQFATFTIRIRASPSPSQ